MLLQYWTFPKNPDARASASIGRSFWLTIMGGTMQKRVVLLYYRYMFYAILYRTFPGLMIIASHAMPLAQPSPSR